ncbi:SGNH/GDSL hydrolase family protein [Nocardia camponoti]|uniref:SGNH hydrolase-type esterase domain-containing protein n=1 Tax=Nocardia camponoti TaxID=1616106 RepID=A0A917VD19_9NOCA|nr:SGNH/GDSL hydrolase family protein [Nocardia camponoti]GGK62669.1 hypothetical protein GCM10011591_38620 [Nocardia camponoti]
MTATHEVHELSDPLVLPDTEIRSLLFGAPWRRFAVMGDSIALGTGDPSPGYAHKGWADRVADALGEANPGVAYLNTGRVGATSGQVIEEQLSRVIAFQPDLVHVNCGANDLFTAGGNPDEVRRNLTALFTALTDAGATISCFALADVWEIDRMAPMRPMRARMAELNTIVKDVALQHDAVFGDFWTHPVRLRPETMSADLIHFTASGHAVVASEIVRLLGARIVR